jgi:Rieske Fe-S protein
VTTQQLSRRSALRGLAVTLSGAVVGFVLARNSDAAGARGAATAANGYGAVTHPGGRRLAGVNQVPAGGGLILDAEKIVLTRTDSGSIHAFSAICTHQGCPVTSVSGGTINCPCHGSRFDIDTGAVVAGPASQPLPGVDVTVRRASVYTT